MSGETVVRSSRGSPEDVLVGMKVKLLEEDVADAVLDEEARAGEAHLARVVVLAGRLARGRVDVGVLEHDEGVLAAELAGERNDVAGRRDADVTRRLGRAGERDTTDQRVGDERGARLLADPLNDVEDAGRQPRLGDEVGEQRARERRPLRRLEHDRAAGSQGRGRLPGRKHEGGVPRCDHRDRPRGHPLHAVPGAVRAPVPLLVGDGEIGVGPVVPRSTGDDAGSERAQQHRHVLALDGSEALDVRIDEVAEPSQVVGAARRAERRPGGEGVVRGEDGAVDLLRPRSGHLGEQALVDRRAVLEALCGRDPLAADEVVGRDGDAGDLDPMVHGRCARGARAPSR